MLLRGAGREPGRGVVDHRTGGGKLFITNSTFQNLAGTAIGHGPTSGGVRIDIVVDNVKIFNALYGVAVSSGARAVVRNSVVTGCTNAGLYADGITTPSTLMIENTLTNNNGTGVQNFGGASGATISISNSIISNNATAILGPTLSFLNNKIVGNTSNGTTPTNIAQQ